MSCVCAVWPVLYELEIDLMLNFNAQMIDPSILDAGAIK